jgi:hypothetical protein
MMRVDELMMMRELMMGMMERERERKRERERERERENQTKRGF